MSLSGVKTLTAYLSTMVQSILGLIGTVSFHVISIQLACAISAVCYYVMFVNIVLPMIGLRPLLEPKDTVGKTGSCHHCSGRLLVVAISQLVLMVPTHVETANVLQLSSRCWIKVSSTSSLYNGFSSLAGHWGHRFED